MVLKTLTIAIGLLAESTVPARTRADTIKGLLGAVDKSDKKTQVTTQRYEAVRDGAMSAPGDAQADLVGAPVTPEMSALHVEEEVAHSGQEMSSKTWNADSKAKVPAPAAELPPEAEEVTLQKEEAASSARSASDAFQSPDIEQAEKAANSPTSSNAASGSPEIEQPEQLFKSKEDKENQGGKVASSANAAGPGIVSSNTERHSSRDAPRIERRPSRNGKNHTEAEFLQHYGDVWGAKKWDEAKQQKEHREVASLANAARAALRSLETERRAAVNGRYFTKAQFIAHYGDSLGAQKWDDAKEDRESQYPKVATFNNAARAALQSLSQHVKLYLGYY